MKNRVLSYRRQTLREAKAVAEANSRLMAAWGGEWAHRVRTGGHGIPWGLVEMLCQEAAVGAECCCSTH